MKFVPYGIEDDFLPRKAIRISSVTNNCLSDIAFRVLLVVDGIRSHVILNVAGIQQILHAFYI